MPNRIGGMDAFYWAFDAATKEQGYLVDWYFPNTANHGDYPKLTIHASGSEAVELFFLEQVKQKHMHYDVIMCHFVELCTPFYKHVKEQLPQSKVIAVDHNPRPLGGYPLKKRFIKRIKGWLYTRYIDTFIAVSESSRLELFQDFGTNLQKKIHVIFNGLITSSIIIRKPSNHKTPRFLVTSHLRKEKGIQDLIEAVAQIPFNNRQKLVIDVYGEGPYEAELKKRIQQYQLEQHFHFKGSVDTVHTLYCLYDYLLHPSHAETFCYSLVESLLANVPVITTNDAGNILKLIKDGENGFLFNSRDSKKLSNILNDLLTTDKQLIIDTRHQIEEKFNLEHCITNYIQLLS